MTKKQLYKVTKDIGFKEYAIGLCDSDAKYHEFKTNHRRLIKQGTIVQETHVTLGLLVTKYFLFVPKMNITVLIKHGIDSFEDYFEKYTPNYNKIWDFVNEY